jgi:predicted nucleic acid-binding protein
VIVLDASATVDLLLGLQPHARTIARLVARAAHDISAPHLLDVEVTQVLRRQLRARRLDPAIAEDALADLADLPLTRYAHGMLLPRALELRDNLTIYDGVYVALAESLGATLVTRDASLARAPGHRARVRLIA